jgi:hypothetical protein
MGSVQPVTPSLGLSMSGTFASMPVSANSTMSSAGGAVGVASRSVSPAPDRTYKFAAALARGEQAGKLVASTSGGAGGRDSITGAGALVATGPIASVQVAKKAFDSATASQRDGLLPLHRLPSLVAQLGAPLDPYFAQVCRACHACHACHV